MKDLSFQPVRYNTSFSFAYHICVWYLKTFFCNLISTKFFNNHVSLKIKMHIGTEQNIIRLSPQVKIKSFGMLILLIKIMRCGRRFISRCVCVSVCLCVCGLLNGEAAILNIF